MLAPSDIKPIMESLKEFYFNICSADKAAYATKTITIYPIGQQYQWLYNLNNKISLFRDSSDKWYQRRMGLVSQTISTFVNYSILFSAIYECMNEADNKEEALMCLHELEKEADKNIKTINRLKEDFSQYLIASKNVVKNIEDSIDEGWNQLSSTEGEILTLANKITKTQTALQVLDDATALNSISSTTVGDCKSVYSTLGSICYAMIVDGLSIPYLSVGILGYSFVNSIIDIFSNGAEFDKKMDELKEYSKKFTLEQKALAQTKAVIKLLYSLNDIIKQQGNSMGQLAAFWQNEKRNIITVINNIESNKEYIKENPEVMQLSIANTVWKMISETASELLVALNHNNKPNSGSKNKITIAV